MEGSGECPLASSRSSPTRRPGSLPDRSTQKGRGVGRGLVLLSRSRLRGVQGLGGRRVSSRGSERADTRPFRRVEVPTRREGTPKGPTGHYPTPEVSTGSGFGLRMDDTGCPSGPSAVVRSLVVPSRPS